MFDRKQLKLTARGTLSRAHWWVVLIVLLTFMMGGSIGSGLQGGMGSFTFSSDELSELDTVATTGETWETPEQIADGVSLAAQQVWNDFLARPLFWITLALATLLASLAFVLLVGSLITVGAHRWLARFWLGETPSVVSLFDPWHTAYRRTVAVMALRFLYVFLWGLLIVPGVIKSYAYSMVPYLIGEYPELTPKEALRMSDNLTRGHKKDLFLLDLSFFGWLLLSAITGGIVGILYVYPYMGVTHAGVYQQLKAEAIRSGKLTSEE